MAPINDAVNSSELRILNKTERSARAVVKRNRLVQIEDGHGGGGYGGEVSGSRWLTVELLAATRPGPRIRAPVRTRQISAVALWRHVPPLGTPWLAFLPPKPGSEPVRSSSAPGSVSHASPISVLVPHARNDI